MLRVPPRLYVILFALAALTLAGCLGQGEVDEAAGTYANTMAEEHAGDEPVATASAREPDVPVEGRAVTYGQRGGQSLRGYYAAPSNADSLAQAVGLPSAGALPGLVVVHEWWGLNDNIRTMTRRLAGQGYRALAVDLYGGEVAEESSRARELMQQAREDQSRIQANVRAAQVYLSQEAGVPRTGVIGWCFGGNVALNAAVAHGETLDAAVIYYGHLVTDRSRLQKIDMPVLGFFGAEDSSIPIDQVRTFEDVLREVSEQEVEVHVYENAGHAFANPSGNSYVPEAAEDAWDETTDFLQRHLLTQSH